jgi:cell division septum initiation protein DivIVA
MRKISKADAAHLEAVQVAADAATTARDVAKRASEVAQQVADKAAETADKVLLFAQDMQYIKTDIKEIKDKLDNKYVTKEEFSIVRSLVFGLVALILTAFVGGLVFLVFK